MTWFTGGAIVIASILMANAVLLVFRFRSKSGSRVRSEIRSGRITKAGIAVYLIFTIALLVGTIARQMVPESSLGALLQTWYGVAAYAVWCIFGATVLGMLLAHSGFALHRTEQTARADNA